MGRGADILVLVILLGAISGMILSVIIGRFMGAFLLTFSYKVFQAIVMDD